MASKDFFLNSDDAQTMGNINYMRKSIKIRHTFPKNLTNPNGLETFKSVSSLDDNSVNSFSEVSQENSLSNPSFQSSSSNSKSVPSSNNMDMFRNMARKIRKK